MPSRPLPDIPGAYLARIIGSWEGLPDDTTLGFRTIPAAATGAADVAVAQAIGDAVAMRWNAFATSDMHNSYRATEVTVYPLHTPTHPATSSATTAAGGLSGDPSAAPLAMAIRHEVVRRGRGSQSRNYIQPFTSAAIDTTGKALIDTFRDSVTANWLTFMTAVQADVAAALAVALFHVQISKIPPGATYAIDGSTCESLLSTQRRRTRRSG